MNCIAIGHFREEDDTPHQIVVTDTGYMRKIPDGRNEETRLVTDTLCGEFNAVIHQNIDEDGNMIETKEEILSRTGARNYLYHKLHKDRISTGNIFLSEGCYYYLQQWLDYSRVPKARHNRQLKLAGELFEIVNSRKQGRDCRAWMFRSPDMWTIADENLCLGQISTKSLSLVTYATDMLNRLPNEIFCHIIEFMDSLLSCFCLARTSKWLSNELNNPSFLHRAFRAMASSPTGCLFWTQPVALMRGEITQAYGATSTFLPKGVSPAANKQKSSSPFGHKDFPWLYFIRFCWKSDFVRNRKRLWEQVKQMEEVWINYRLHGSEVDRFDVALE